MEASNTPAPTGAQAASTEAAMPTDGPWNWSWDKVASAAGNYTQEQLTPAQTDTLIPKNPWEMSGADLAKVTNNVRQVDYSQPTPSANLNISNTGLFARLVNTESGGRHLDDNGNLLTSSAGAQGITQVMPQTGGDPGYGVTPIQDKSVGEYLRFGKDYLNAMVSHFGDQSQALAAYNAGPGTVEKAITKAQKTGGDWRTYVPSETRTYIKKIMGA